MVILVSRLFIFITYVSGEWAIPGGMVDAGETVSATLKREFTEEALGNVSQESLDELWKNGVELYKCV